VIEVQADLKRGDFRLKADFTGGAGVTVLFGRSGSGKTSIANLVAGLVQPEHGRVVVNGETVCDTESGLERPAWRRQIGYVFQDTRLFPHLNVRENLLYGARRRGVVAARIDPVVDLLALEGQLEQRPATLSGGEARRVAIGRALLSEPKLLILDEPLSGLDGARRVEILPYLDELARSGPPILYVTHAVDEAARLADEMVLVVDGQAFNAGPPDRAFARSEATDAAGLGAPISVLEGQALAEGGGPVTVVDLGGTQFHTPPLAITPGGRVRIVVDARDVAVALTAPADASFQNALGARVEAITPASDGLLIQLEGQGFRLTSLVTSQAAERLELRPGLEVVALVKATATARYA